VNHAADLAGDAWSDLRRTLDDLLELSPETVPRQSEVLAEAVDLLGPASSASRPRRGHLRRPGRRAGLLDYPALFRQLARLAPVPVIVQDAHERHAARVRTDLLRWHAEASARSEWRRHHA
jgi:hypothetical protein